MKLPGRTPILVELDKDEYNALSKFSDSSKLSMTLIVRDLIREHLMSEELISSLLSKRILLFSEDETDKQAVVVHLADDEYDFLTDYAKTKNKTMTTVVRNLIRKFIMNVGELKD